MREAYLEANYEKVLRYLLNVSIIEAGLGTTVDFLCYIVL